MSYSGLVLIKNRNGLVVQAQVLPARGKAEREAAVAMIGAIPGDQRVTVAVDKDYHSQHFRGRDCNFHATPHVAQNNRNRRSAHRWANDSSCCV